MKQPLTVEEQKALAAYAYGLQNAASNEPMNGRLHELLENVPYERWARINSQAQLAQEGPFPGSASPEYPGNASVGLEEPSQGQRESLHGQQEQLSAVESVVHSSSALRRTQASGFRGYLQRWFERVLRGFPGW